MLYASTFETSSLIDRIILYSKFLFLYSNPVTFKFYFYRAKLFQRKKTPANSTKGKDRPPATSVLLPQGNNVSGALNGIISCFSSLLSNLIKGRKV